MLTKILSYLTILLMSVESFAKEYVVKVGDTLSEVSQFHFPNRRIYGEHGSLNMLVKLNNLTNPDFIFPKQKIKITQSSTPLKSFSNTKNDKQENFKQLVTESCKLFFQFGLSYYHFSQLDGPGNAEFAIWVTNYQKLGLTKRFKNITWENEFEISKFKYEIEGERHVQNFNTFNSNFINKNFLFGIRYLETPLFHEEDNVEIYKIKLLNFNFGIDFKFMNLGNLFSRINFRTIASIPIMSMNDSSIQMHKIYGLNLDLEASYRQHLMKLIEQKWNAILSLKSYYSLLNSRISFNNYEGIFKSETFGTSFLIGIETHF